MDDKFEIIFIGDQTIIRAKILVTQKVYDSETESKLIFCGKYTILRFWNYISENLGHGLGKTSDTRVRQCMVWSVSNIGWSNFEIMYRILLLIGGY